ncbi:MAG: adenylate/guanylate cyclase domain-containing protein, partial [Chlamydiae bacterium]|nr:adenylate/guanylate cyclase domain-containing protein [Chlamydiota bacterium]
ELLLLNVFPQKIVERLRKGEETIADEYQASVLFADIVDFTKSTYQLGPTKVVQLLNELFGEFDKIVDCFGVEKVKTIGDNYMAVAGVPIPVPDHSMRLADFALALKDLLLHFNEKHDLQVQMRIGMDCGTLIAGIIGHKKSIYDVWGDVVNTASRMESTSLQGEIQVSEKMALLLEEKFLLQAREPFEVKGKGLMQTYFLKGKKVIS